MSNQTFIIDVKKIHPEAIVPKQMQLGDAGFDAYSVENATLAPFETAVIDTGIAIEMPSSLECQVRPRSGLAAKYGVTVLNSPGTIDSNWRGPIGIILINMNPTESFTINKGDRIAQLLFKEVPSVLLIEVGYLSDSNRGTKGYGSSGV